MAGRDRGELPAAAAFCCVFVLASQEEEGPCAPRARITILWGRQLLLLFGGERSRGGGLLLSLFEYSCIFPREKNSPGPPLTPSPSKFLSRVRQREMRVRSKRSGVLAVLPRFLRFVVAQYANPAVAKLIIPLVPPYCE